MERGVGPDSRMDTITLGGRDAEVGLVWQDAAETAGPKLGAGVSELQLVPADTYPMACTEAIPPR
jgi:hypothetical protein